MNHTSAQSYFAASLSGELDRQESAALAAHLEECATCATEYQRYRGIVALEQQLAEQEPGWGTVDLVDEVMASIHGERTPVHARPAWVVPLIGSNVALLAAVILLLLVPSARERTVFVGVNGWSASAAQPVAYREEGGGLRMITVDLDTTLPTQIPLSNATRADVTVTLDTPGANPGTERRSEVLAQFVPVVAIELAAGSVPRASLLVSTETARRIDIARVIGSVKLSLYSARGGIAASAAPLSDPDGRPVGGELSTETVAVMYRTSPQRSEPVRMVFSNGSWEEKSGVDVQAF